MIHSTEERAVSALSARGKGLTRPDDSGNSPFRSFWMGGFEAAGHINEVGARVNMLAATQHDRYVAEDFALVRSVGIGTVRESAQWHLIDRDGVLDFSTLAPVAEAAQAAGVQVLWTLCHYGWPEDLDLFSDELVARFAAYCERVFRVLSVARESTLVSAHAHLALRQPVPLAKAGADAQALIAKWEGMNSDITPSQPQVSIGSKVSAWLAPLEARMPRTATPMVGRRAITIFDQK